MPQASTFMSGFQTFHPSVPVARSCWSLLLPGSQAAMAPALPGVLIRCRCSTGSLAWACRRPAEEAHTSDKSHHWFLEQAVTGQRRCYPWQPLLSEKHSKKTQTVFSQPKATS